MKALRPTPHRLMSTKDGITHVVEYTQRSGGRPTRPRTALARPESGWKIHSHSSETATPETTAGR
jgi:hypothetical protein